MKLQVTWKLPLATLLSQFSRPPLNSSVWTNTSVFLLSRVIGNPICTIASLLRTISACEQRIKALRQRISHAPPSTGLRKRKQLRKYSFHKTESLTTKLALIQVSTDEWGVIGSEQVLLDILDQLYYHEIPDEKFQRILDLINTTAGKLAADRSTAILPVFAAEFQFITSIGAAYWRVIGMEPHPGLWTNIEAYSIAMSAPFLYMVPAVFLSAIIGVSQTERSIPRILKGFYEELAREQEQPSNEKMEVVSLENQSQVELESPAADEEKGIITIVEEEKKPITVNGKQTILERIAHGGMYSWRPEILLPRNLSKSWPHITLATIMVLLSVFVAGWISYRVPPEGFDCRNAGQMALLGTWLLSFAFEFVFVLAMDRLSHLQLRESWLYEIMFVKDCVMGAAAVVMILVVQVGIFNRCDCFSLWGRVPVAFPQIPEVAAVLMRRIEFEWPAVTFGWIMIELGLCGGIWWYYRDAIAVYNQQDLEMTIEIPGGQGGQKI
ncbi:hypothetical protein QBC35DRAFT_385585 [Podospora australis]|uniref:Uncharacterized protein n=1 Tax=Podospora australis TaxID=1536484 RepID=A0AAN7AIQ7_9PEZI|nr:hypothetical protein QBC35DRAFT_385585 [Podospora australis]